jgi:phage terminase large subunit-like protein
VKRRAPRNAAANHAAAFIGRLTHTKGQWAGQPFNLRPWQGWIIRTLFGARHPDGRRQYRTCYVEIPRKNGKRLALDTLLPTPTGWIKMADVEVGTTLFDERGAPCRVVRVEPIADETRAYRVRFSDGTAIDADAEHLWVTRAKRNGNGQHGRPRRSADDVRTTEEIAETLWYDQAKREANHAVAVAGALDCPSADLPLPPYVLGAWLGDGATAGAGFTCHDRDRQIIDEIRAAGVAIHETTGTRGATRAYRLGTGARAQADRDVSPQAVLRALGVLGQKHIPAAYLRGSIAQRLALLQGLMDTDGYCSPTGSCELTTVSPMLRDGAVELIRSLGFKPAVREEPAVLGGRRVGTKHRVLFHGSADTPVFRLRRKLARLPLCRSRARWRQIIAADPIESVPMRCIAVDSPSRLYLAGEGMIPTHNTELAAAIALYMLLGDAEEGAEVYGCAVDLEQAGLAYHVAAQMIRNYPELAETVEVIPSRKRIVHHASGSFYRAIPGDAPSAHGYNASAVLYDELHAAPSRDLWDVLTTSMGARRQPLTFVITTAGYDRHSICWELHAYAEKVRDGLIDDPTFLPVLYGAPVDADWQDEAVWRAANPALGDFRSLDEMRVMAKQAREVPARQNTFRRLYLCQWTESETRWLDPTAWDACAGPTPWAELGDALRGRRGWLGLDLSSTTDLTALVGAFPAEDGEVEVLARFWLPEEHLARRVQRDRVPYDQWARDGALELTPGNVVDYARIRAAVNEWAERYDVGEVAFDPWNATGLVTQLQDDGATCVPIRQGFASLTAPTKELEKLVTSRALRHGGHPVLRWCAGNVVVETDPAGNLKPSKAKSTERIDGVVALILALSRAMVGPEGSVYEKRGLQWV